VAFHDELVDIGGVEDVEVLQGEVVDLSRHRDSSTKSASLHPTRPAANCSSAS
jgi:hypothetical protein